MFGSSKETGSVVLLEVHRYLTQVFEIYTGVMVDVRPLIIKNAMIKAASDWPDHINITVRGWISLPEFSKGERREFTADFMLLRHDDTDFGPWRVRFSHMITFKSSDEHDQERAFRCEPRIVSGSTFPEVHVMESRDHSIHIGQHLGNRRVVPFEEYEYRDELPWCIAFQ